MYYLFIVNNQAQIISHTRDYDDLLIQGMPPEYYRSEEFQNRFFTRLTNLVNQFLTFLDKEFD